MLQINQMTMVEIAKTNGWVHTRGRLAGSINAAAMAEALGVAPTTVIRAYDGGQQAGAVLVEKLHQASGLSFDRILEVVPDDAVAA